MTWKARFLKCSFKKSFLDFYGSEIWYEVGIWMDSTSMMGLALIDQVTHLIPMNLWRIPIWWNESCQKFRWLFWRDGFSTIDTSLFCKAKEIIFLLFMSNFTSSKQIFSLVFIFFNHFPYHIPNNCLFLCVEKRRMNDRERNVASNFLVFALNKEGVAFKTGCSWHSYSVCHNGATICGLERAKPLSNEGERSELSKM